MQNFHLPHVDGNTLEGEIQIVHFSHAPEGLNDLLGMSLVGCVEVVN